MEGILNRIKEIRTAKKISQDQISKHLGITQAAYAKVESSKSITVDRLYKVAEILNVSVGDLLRIEVSENKGKEEELKAEIERLTKIVKGQRELLDLNDKLLKHYEKTYVAIYQESLVIVDDAISTVIADFITIQNDPNATFQTNELKNKVMEQMRSKYIDFFTIAFQKMAAKTSNE